MDSLAQVSSPWWHSTQMQKAAGWSQTAVTGNKLASLSPVSPSRAANLHACKQATCQVKVMAHLRQEPEVEPQRTQPSTHSHDWPLICLKLLLGSWILTLSFVLRVKLMSAPDQKKKHWKQDMMQSLNYQTQKQHSRDHPDSQYDKNLSISKASVTLNDPPPSV